MPVVVGADAAPSTFSADRAMEHIRDWATEPRPTGSAAHAAVVDALEEELQALGFDVRRQTPGVLVNLVASAPGADAGGVWLVAHSDSVAGGPGATDDGLGLGVLVEVARALSIDQPPAELHLLITDGEEQGLFGAEAFVADAPQAERLAINLDARGTEGPAYMFQMAGTRPDLLTAWTESGCTAQATSLAQTVYDLLPNDTDFTILRRAGWQGYNFALIGGAWRYHTAEDTVENLDPRSLQQVGDCVLGLARTWLDRGVVATSDGPELAYAQLAGQTVAVPGWLVSLLGLLPLGLVGWRTTPRSCVTFLGGVLVSGIGGFLLSLGARAYWPGFVTAIAEVPGPGPLYAGALSLGLGGCALVRRFSPDGMAAATILLTAAVAVAAPEVGYLLVPGAWVAGLRGRQAAWLTILPALLAGLLLGPFYAAICPGLTTRMLPLLALVPLGTLGFLFVRVPRQVNARAG